MKALREIDPGSSAFVGWRVRVMVLTHEATNATTNIEMRLSGLGAIVETEMETFTALDTMVLDATGYGLCVIECDTLGGIERGRQIVGMMRKGGVSVPAVLVSKECREQIFPTDTNNPIVLRAPLSAVALRVGVEHALRDRLVFEAA